MRPEKTPKKERKPTEKTTCEVRKKNDRKKKKPTCKDLKNKKKQQKNNEIVKN